MVRDYLSYLRFTNTPDPMVDIESAGAHWSTVGNVTFTNPSFLGELDKEHVCMTANSPNSYIMCDKSIRTYTNKITVAIKYRIPEKDIYKALYDLEPIPILKWSNGMVNVLDHYDTDNICIGVTIDGVTYKGIIQYDVIGFGEPVQLYLTVDNHKLLVFANDKRIIDKYIPNGLTELSDICMGNCGDSEVVVEIDELAITDWIDLPTKYLVSSYHSVYPEADDVEVVVPRRVNTVSSYDLVTTDMDITRHSDYTAPKSYKVDRIRRYNYDNEREG